MQQTGFIGSMTGDGDLTENYNDYMYWGDKT
jgi:hypothetical protein